MSRKDDCISRQMAIEEVKKLFEMGECYCDRASIIGMLNSMPSALVRKKMARWYDWTLVTEGNPDADDLETYYVTWVDDHNHRYIGWCNYDPDEERWITEDMEQIKDGWTKTATIIAWIPCPDPYVED